MLQTTTNQLSRKQIMLKHRLQIINELTNSGYADIITDKNNTNEYFIVNVYNSPIKTSLDLSLLRNTTKEIGDIYHYDTNKSCTITCELFTTEDISAFTDLYIHMLKCKNQDIVDTITYIDNLTLEPGQFAEIISEYLTKKENT